jgi:predicted ArsR family transcriptional regulator
VAEATAGRLTAAEVAARLTALDELGPTRAAVAERLGVHRNTLRRQLQAIAKRGGE